MTVLFTTINFFKWDELNKLKKKYVWKEIRLKPKIFVFRNISLYLGGGRLRGRDLMVVRFTTICASVPIKTEVLSSNLIHDEVYSTQHYAIKCHWLATGRWFSPVFRFPPPIKLTTKIYLKYCWKWR